MKASAPRSDLKHPEFLSLILSFRMPRSEALLGRYCRVSKEVEDVVATFEQAVFERCELPVQFGQFFVNKLVQPVKPRLCVDGFCRLLIPFMYRFLKKVFHGL